MISVREPETALILRLLAERKLLGGRTEEDAARALVGRAGTAEEALVASLHVDESAIAEAYARHLGIPWLCLERRRARGAPGPRPAASPAPAAGEPEPRALLLRDGMDPLELGTVRSMAESCRPFADLVSESVCRRAKVVPFGVTQGSLDLACSNPASFLLLEEIQLRCGLLVRPHAATLSLIDALLAAFFEKPGAATERSREPAAAARADAADASAPEVLLDLQRHTSAGGDDQVVRIVRILLRGAVDQGASDIHLDPYEKEGRVRYRIDGTLVEVAPPPSALFGPTIARLKQLSKMSVAEERLPQGGMFAVRHNDKLVHFRTTTLPTVHGEKLVIRLLGEGGIPGSLQDLGFSPLQADDLLGAPRHGLVLVTGPERSGKTTTLYTCLAALNAPALDVATVEDPVEQRFRGLNQVQVSHAAGLGTARALRAILRQDPDVIMVSQLDDAETAQLCVQAALEERFVLTTLPAGSSLDAIDRLVGLGIEPASLGRALRSIAAQRLVRRLCAECKQEIEAPADVAGRHGLDVATRIHRPGGRACTGCRGTGFKGRVGLYEVVPIAEELRELVRGRAPHAELRRAAARRGALFLADAAREKLLSGVTSVDEISEHVRRVEGA